MKVERVEVRELALPLRHPFETSFGRTTRKEFLLVAVSAGRGHRLRRVRGRRRSLLPARDQRHRRSTCSTTSWSRSLCASTSPIRATSGRRLARVRGHEMAKAALEMAVWELWARREGVPAVRACSAARGGPSQPASPSACRRTTAALVEQGRGGGRRRLPAHQDQDQARPRPARSVARRARALPRRCR